MYIHISSDSMNPEWVIRLARDQGERIAAIKKEYGAIVEEMDIWEKEAFEQEERNIIAREKYKIQYAIDAKRLAVKAEQKRAEQALEAKDREHGTSTHMLITAVKSQSLSDVERLLNSFPHLNPMHRPKDGVEDVDCSNMGRRQGFPVQNYGYSAIMEAIVLENVPILLVLLERLPEWVGNAGMDLLRQIEICTHEEKMNSLAVILRVKGYPVVAGFDPLFAKRFVERRRQNASAFLLRLEKETPGYFHDNWDDISSVIDRANEM